MERLIVSTGLEILASLCSENYRCVHIAKPILKFKRENDKYTYFVEWKYLPCVHKKTNEWSARDDDEEEGVGGGGEKWKISCTFWKSLR